MFLFDLIIGLGIFLFGMLQLETGLESLGSRWMKRGLASSTSGPIRSVFAGTVITAVMQSSSMVGLIVLAFASAGMIPLFNAIGVMLGANLGTTFTGWVVATLGFKLNLSTLALPAIGIGSLLQVVYKARSRNAAIGKLFFGLGLLLFGLDIMKASVADLPEAIDLQALQSLNSFGFLLIGIGLTAVIQSSSATMMLTLTALHGGIIELPAAGALVIGADLGTTSTTALGSLKGSPIKRQLALAHFVFNLIVDVLAFFLLLPLIPWLFQLLNFSDPLYGLVAFHSAFNVIGLCLFIPLLPRFCDWIAGHFVDTKRINLTNVPTEVPDAALTACDLHTREILLSALGLNLRNLKIDVGSLAVSGNIKQRLHDLQEQSESFEQRYERLKQLEGELHRYARILQRQSLDENDVRHLLALLDASRNAVYASKALKDIRVNLFELRHADEPELQDFYRNYQLELKGFLQVLLELLLKPHHGGYIDEKLAQLQSRNEEIHDKFHSQIMAYKPQADTEPDQLSTLLNINREVWYCGINLIASTRALLINSATAS